MKKTIVISIIIILLALITSVIMFTNIGGELREYIAYKIFVPKETFKIEPQENIKIRYTYSWTNEGFEIEVTDKQLINFITENISNKKLNNYSGQIGLAIMGEYTVELGNNISLKFDSNEKEGYVMIKDEAKNFLTKIEPEILRKVEQIVDEKLTQNIEIFKTDQVRISENSEKCIVGRQIEEKTAIEYILERCKNIYIKEINYEPNIVRPNYEIQFNDNVKLLVYNMQSKGWLLKDGILSEAYGLNIFETIIKNAFDNVEEREKMFKTDKITLISPEQTVEIRDQDIIEKITTNLMYSTIGEPKWLATYDITKEYNNGIKVQLNDYQFLIPGDKTIGNRYIISKDKKLELCYPLQDIEQYIYEVLGIKKENKGGPISIAVPYDIPEGKDTGDNKIN